MITMNAMMTSPRKVVCGFCHKGGEESSTSGRLYSHESIHAHLRCMQYSSGLAQYQKGRYPQLGGFKWSQVRDEMKRGSHLKCHVCGKKKGAVRGATAGCTIRKCMKTFHFTCAALDKTAITKRIVVHSPGEDEKVFYRVFCGKAHCQIYENQELKKLGAYEYQSDSEEDDDEEDEDDDSGTSEPQSSAKDTVSEDRLSTTTESSSERKHGYCDDSNLSEISGSSPKKPKTDSQSESGTEDNSLDSSKDNTSSNSHAAKAESPSFKGTCDAASDECDGVNVNNTSTNTSTNTNTNLKDISDNTCASNMSVKSDCGTKTDGSLSKDCSDGGFEQEGSSDVDRNDDGSGVVDGATSEACRPLSDSPSALSGIQA